MQALITPDILTGRRVLVAEDNEVSQLMLRLQLQKWGAEVVIVENGAEAVEYLDREHFDLVLFDIEMPQVNGIEATRKLRTENGLTTPIIGITHTDYMGRAMAAGMNAVLRKPIESKNLFRAIQEVLR